MKIPSSRTEKDPRVRRRRMERCCSERGPFDVERSEKRIRIVRVGRVYMMKGKRRARTGG